MFDLLSVLLLYITIIMDQFIDIYKHILLENIKKNKRLNSLYFGNHKHQKYCYNEIINDILYLLKTGIPWRQIRSHIKWQTLYWHFRQFVAQNLFTKTFKQITKIYQHQNGNILITDTSFIQNKYGVNKLGRNRFFKNKNCNKISLITTQNGTPLSIYIDKGNKHDISYLNCHIKTIYMVTKKKSALLLADKAYHSKYITKDLKDRNISIMIQNKKNMVQQPTFNKQIYKKRIAIENTFQRLKCFRRINLRYDKLFSIYCNFCYIAASIDFLYKI